MGVKDIADATSQSDFIIPPMFTTGMTGSTGQTYPATGPSCFAVNTTPIVIDLTTICGAGSKAKVPFGNDDYNPNPEGHYATMQADGDDIYYVFGDSVATIGTISPTAVSTVSGTGVASATFTPTSCIRLQNLATKDFKLPLGSPPPGSPQDNNLVGRYAPARYLSVRSNTGATVFLRIFQSSP